MIRTKILLKFLAATLACSTIGVFSSFTVSAKIRSDALYTFDVLSDTHIGASSQTDTNSAIALEAIKRWFPEDRCIVINGDVVDNYYDPAYEKLEKVVKESNLDNNLPYIYFNIGNHELRPDAHSSSRVEDFQWSMAQFNKWTRKVQIGLSARNVTYTCKRDDIAYDTQYINKDGGTQDILYFLGTDRLEYGDYNSCAFLDKDTQLRDLKKKLDTGKLTFIFCHQPPYGTVHYSDWKNSIYKSEELNSIIKGHSNAIFFSGHEHNDFNYYKFIGGNDNYSYYPGYPVFGTSSAGYLAQGCHVEVLENKVIVYAIQYNPGATLKDCNILAVKEVAVHSNN